MKTYYIYILTNKPRGILYTGITSNISKRIQEHRSGKGGYFTSKYNLFRLVYIETFDNPDSAILREKYIKNRNKAWKIRVIESLNPNWEDLIAQGFVFS